MASAHRPPLTAALPPPRRPSSTLSECGLLRGIRRKLPGSSVQIVSCRYEELPTPSVVSLRLNFLAYHAVVVERATPVLVRLIDPGSGSVSMTREAFERE